VRQRGKEAYKLKLTNKNYKYYNGLESGNQVVGNEYTCNNIRID
jgi:hypothetical protein